MTQASLDGLTHAAILAWLSRMRRRMRLEGDDGAGPLILVGAAGPGILRLWRAFVPDCTRPVLVLDTDPVLLAGAAALRPQGFAAASRMLSAQGDLPDLAAFCRHVLGADRLCDDPDLAPLGRLHHPITPGSLRALIAANDPASRALRAPLEALRRRVLTDIDALPGAAPAWILSGGRDAAIGTLLAAMRPDRPMHAMAFAVTDAPNDPERRGVMVHGGPDQPIMALAAHADLVDRLAALPAPQLEPVLQAIRRDAALPDWRIEDRLAACLPAPKDEAPGAQGYFSSHEARAAETADGADRPAQWAGSVAVVTRTKDRPLLLARAARSVSEQSWRNFRWVIVNDGGDPAPIDAILRDSGVDPDRITRIDNPESRGMEAASNQGVRAVDTEFVVIHDDDDQWHPDFLRDSLAFLTAPRAAAAGFEGVLSRAWRVSERIDGDRVTILGSEPFMPWVAEVPLAQMAVGNFCAPISLLYRRRMFDAIGGYDESLPVLGDWRFNLDFLARANIGFLDRYLAWYHHRDMPQPQPGYANSVVGARDLHRQYFSVVTNGILRDPATPEPLRLVLATAHLQRVTERNLNGLRASLSQGQSRPPEQAPPKTGQVDLPRANLRRAGLPRADRDHLHASLARALPWTASPRRILARLRWEWRLRRMDDPQLRRRLLPRLLRLVPSPADFDHITYLQRNPQIWATRFNGPDEALPYHHFLLVGLAEGQDRPEPPPPGQR